jgi:hypothetical protein
LLGLLREFFDVSKRKFKGVRVLGSSTELKDSGYCSKMVAKGNISEKEARVDTKV